MIDKLKFGSEYLKLDLAVDTSLFQPVAAGEKYSAAEFQNLFQQSIPANADLSSVAISIADKTRLCGYPDYLPVVVEVLRQSGAGDITFYIAYGTHPPQSDEESLNAYGEIFNKENFIHHSCHDKELFQDFGMSTGGTPVRIRKDYLDSSFKITFGAISHHYFAGFGGSRKLIFPGLGEKDAIYHNHSLYLSRESKTLEPGCQPGIIAGNPLAEDLQECADYAGVDLAIHGIVAPTGVITDIVMGEPRKSFAQACERYAAFTEIEVEKGFDCVVASAGGFPKDINLIQTHKAIHYASMFVNDGGDLYLLAECRDGVGSKTFLPWYEYPSYDEAFEALLKDYQGNGGTALSLQLKTRRINIHFITAMPVDICDKINLIYHSPDEFPDICIKIQNKYDSVAVIPNASVTIRKQTGL